jgi:phage-related protein
MTPVVIYREADGKTPFMDWFHRLPFHAQARCRARLQLLAEQGPMLRRPAADYLRDGIYELRVKAERRQYRVLYFFHGRVSVVLSHGFHKRRSLVPPIEIERAMERKRAFLSDPRRHTHAETP